MKTIRGFVRMTLLSVVVMSFAMPICAQDQDRVVEKQVTVEIVANSQVAAGTPSSILDKRLEGPYEARDMKLEEILPGLQNQYGFKYILEGNFRDAKVTFVLKNPTLRELIDTLPENGIPYRILEDGTVYIGSGVVRTKSDMPGPTISEKTYNEVRPGVDRTKLGTPGVVATTADSTMEMTPAKETDKEWLPKTQKSIVIMSNIFDDLLQKQLGDGYKSKGFFSEGCRGYWVPNTGVLFLLSVDFPLEKKAAAIKKENGKAGEKDLWDEYENKLGDTATISRVNIMTPTGIEEVQVSSKTFVEKPIAVYDDKRVEKLRNTILDIIAKYGRRFAGFRNDETITVIVEGANSNPIGVVSVMTDYAQKDEGIGETITNYVYPGVESNDRDNRDREKLKQEFEESKKQWDDLRKSLDEKIKATPNQAGARELLEAQKRYEAVIHQMEMLRTEQQKRAEAAAGNYLEKLGQLKKSGDLFQFRAPYNLRTPFWGSGMRQAKSVMVIQIAFRDIPSQDGAAETIKDKARINTYGDTYGGARGFGYTDIAPNIVPKARRGVGLE